MNAATARGTAAGTAAPVVSIVTPSLQQGAFIEKAIRSVLAQDYPSVEYLILDGGSTDETMEIIRAYAPRIAFWESVPDNGQAHAINKGFARARGSILAWLNADDLLFPDAVSRAVAALTARNASLTYADCLLLNPLGQYLRPFVEVEEYDAFRLRSCSDFIMQPTAFFTRAAYTACGPLDESMHYAFDWDFWCRLAKQRVVVTRYAGYAACAHIHDQAKTQRGSWDRLGEICRTAWRHCAGIWPTAVFALISSGCKQRARTAGFFPRAFWAAAWMACKCLSPRNVLRVLRRPREVQGLEYPRGFCRKRCSVDLPAFEKHTELRLALRALPAQKQDDEQHFSATINGRFAGWRRLPGGCKEHTFTFSLNDHLAGYKERERPLMQRFTLELEFRRDFLPPFPARVLRPRDKGYAARLTGLVLE